METVISNTNKELDEKIKNKIKPEHEDKKRLQSRIKQLDKKQQLHLFHSIIKPLDIYTVTDSGLFFDLNELTPDLFWKLNYEVNLTYDCLKRDRMINALEQQQQQQQPELHSIADRIYNREFDIESTSLFEPNHENGVDLEVEEPYLGPSTISYSQLRDATLSEYKYAKIGEATYNSSLLTSDFESKVLERNVYTDKRR